MAERPLGLSLTSSFSGVITFLRSGSQWAFSAASLSLRRPCFLGLKWCWSKLDRSCPWRKCLTSLSSSEWKVITHRRPPGRSASLAARSPAWSSFSSSLTKIRKAWKVLVAMWAGRLSRSLRAYATAAGSDPGDKEMARIRILKCLNSVNPQLLQRWRQAGRLKKPLSLPLLLPENFSCLWGGLNVSEKRPRSMFSAGAGDARGPGEVIGREHLHLKLCAPLIVVRVWVGRFLLESISISFVVVLTFRDGRLLFSFRGSDWGFPALLQWLKFHRFGWVLIQKGPWTPHDLVVSLGGEVWGWCLGSVRLYVQRNVHSANERGLKRPNKGDPPNISNHFSDTILKPKITAASWRHVTAFSFASN